MTVIPQRYTGSGKRERVENMFDSIAPKYDLLNRVLSAGIDKGWRKKAIDLLIPLQPKSILDIATGTADFALEAERLKPAAIKGVDISEQMLAVGRKKIAERKLSGVITLERGDSEQLQFADNTFDAVTVAFGVRNFENLEKGLIDMLRVLKPGGMAVILEFSQPQQFPVKQFYRFYSRYILPTIGQLVSKERSAYEYLPESVAAFPYGKQFTDILENCGYSATVYYPLTFGIAGIYTGIKKNA
jgi:demethylmenaquinone methyltransferase/2-methoxy-6-polyprenyl-1,4-benzoquinol methylase